MLEEKARRFLAGEKVAAEDLPQMEDKKQNNEKATDKKTLTKEELNQITHPVREAFLVLSTAVASTAFFIYYKTHPKQRKTLRMTA